jgi:hypothetical protein
MSSELPSVIIILIFDSIDRMTIVFCLFCDVLCCAGSSLRHLNQCDESDLRVCAKSLSMMQSNYCTLN